MKETITQNGEDNTSKVHLYSANNEPNDLDAMELGEGEKKLLMNPISTW